MRGCGRWGVEHEWEAKRHGEGEGAGNHLNERRGSRVEWALGGRAGTGVTGGAVGGGKGEKTLEPGERSRCVDLFFVG